MLAWLGTLLFGTDLAARLVSCRIETLLMRDQRLRARHGRALLLIRLPCHRGGGHGGRSCRTPPASSKSMPGTVTWLTSGPRSASYPEGLSSASGRRMRLRTDLRELVATSCRILAATGQADLIWGHASARDPDGRGVWIKSAEWGLGEVTSDTPCRRRAPVLTSATGPSRPGSKKPVTAADDIGDSDDRCIQNVFTITGAGDRPRTLVTRSPRRPYAV
jgi:hypothetical protein